jgi:hypothetical protein
MSDVQERLKKLGQAGRIGTSFASHVIFAVDGGLICCCDHVEFVI